MSFQISANLEISDGVKMILTQLQQVFEIFSKKRQAFPSLFRLETDRKGRGGFPNTVISKNAKSNISLSLG